jgi:DNA mismatch repair protein MutS2
MIRQETLRALEFDKILDAVSGFCMSAASGRSVLDLRPLRLKDEMEKRLGAVGEVRRLSVEGEPLAVSPFEDISGVLEEARPEGAVIEPGGLLAVMSVLGVMAAVSAQLGRRDDLGFLGEVAENLTGFPDILDAIERTVDSEGNVLDGASFELHDIRTRIRALDKKVTRRLEEIVRDGNITPFLQDEFITKRSGRWVIPVRMDAKGQVQGVVHDVSRSGETAFVEPLSIIGLANELENLVAEEKAEVIRILRAISGSIRAVADEIGEQFQTVVYLDVLKSIAAFSDRMDMQPPLIGESPGIRLHGARHPLLMMLGKDGVVPLDLELGGEGSVMAITGPNAGGKTIAIKTAGLLTLMALSGMPVPAASSSVFPLLDDLLVDIGDEQSIESSLSTFSAHVTNIADIIKRSGPKALVLMDELGTGTDPGQGAAIGCAVLRELKGRGALVLCTTHLTDIVAFVHREGGMANASMEFDLETLTPLYRLKAGEPGQSHALETARKYGLPESTVGLAKHILGTAEVEFHSLMADLKRQGAAHEKALSELRQREAEFESEKARLGERLKEADAQRDRVLEQAYQEAGEIVAGIKREVHGILEEAKKQKSRASLRKLEKASKEVDKKLKAFRKEPVLAIADIKEGATVFVHSVGYDARVLKVDGRRKRVRVKTGGKELEVPVSGLGPPKGKAPKEGVSRGPDLEEAVPSHISLLGLRVDDALSKLEPFLNHASLGGLSEVAIVHGIGTGALRRAVREHLEGHPLVEGFRGGAPSEGGDGVTVVKLK